MSNPKKKEWEKITTSVLAGKCPKESDYPLKLAHIHPDFGLLGWDLEDGSILICRSYYIFKKCLREGGTQ